MMRFGRTTRRALWAAAIACLVVVFAVAGRGDGKPPTQAERVEALSRQFACPECSGQSVAVSNAPAAQNIRNAVAEMVADGVPDEQIRGRIVDRFGERVSLTPPAQGVVSLVWVIPVVVAVVAVAALALVLLRWRRTVGDGGEASDADRALVERFLAERDEATDYEVLR
ncbi:MAG: cytochrome c-type biogenesis protein CcmH [Acidimicrobiia bacterium]